MPRAHIVAKLESSPLLAFLLFFGGSFCPPQRLKIQHKVYPCFFCTHLFYFYAAGCPQVNTIIRHTTWETSSSFRKGKKEKIEEAIQKTKKKKKLQIPICNLLLFFPHLLQLLVQLQQSYIRFFPLFVSPLQQSYEHSDEIELPQEPPLNHLDKMRVPRIQLKPHILADRQTTADEAFDS